MDSMSLPQWLSVSGLLLDIGGAWLVAIEVVRQFRGERVRSKGGIEYLDWSVPEMTPEYIRWEARKYKFMAFGLAGLTMGFVLQIIAVIVH